MTQQERALVIVLEMARDQLKEYAEAIPYDVAETKKHKNMINLINNSIKVASDE